MADTASFLDAINEIRNKYEESTDQRIFLRGPNKGLNIEIVHPDLDENKPENSLTIHVSFEVFSI